MVFHIPKAFYKGNILSSKDLGRKGTHATKAAAHMSKSVYLLQLEKRGQGKRVEAEEKNVGEKNLIWQNGWTLVRDLLHWSNFGLCFYTF